MADIQNEYYIHKVRDIRRNMPRQKNDPLSTLRRIMNGRTASFSVSAVSPEEVDKIIRTPKNSKSSVIDNLDTYIIKLSRELIVPSICHIVNLSILSKKFPTKWKIAKVIPCCRVRWRGRGPLWDPWRLLSRGQVRPNLGG